MNPAAPVTRIVDGNSGHPLSADQAIDMANRGPAYRGSRAPVATPRQGRRRGSCAGPCLDALSLVSQVVDLLLSSGEACSPVQDVHRHEYAANQRLRTVVVPPLQTFARSTPTEVMRMPGVEPLPMPTRRRPGKRFRGRH